LVEVREDVVSYYSANIADVEASSRESGQRTITIEVIEEIVFCGGDVTRVETSAWEAR